MPPLPSLPRGKHIQGDISQRVEPRLCRWWGQVTAAPWTVGCLMQGSGAAWSNVARIASCQVSWFRQDRRWGCEAVVRLPQHPVQPHHPPLCHGALYSNKPIWSLPTTGLQCGSPNACKSQSAPNRSTRWVQGMHINLTQPLEHPPVFYSPNRQLPEENSSPVSYSFWWSISSLHLISLLGSARK